MLNGSKRSRGNGDYVFINGKAVRADEAAASSAGGSESVPGFDQAKSVPGQEAASTKKKKAGKKPLSAKDSFKKLEEGDAFEPAEGSDLLLTRQTSSQHYVEERRKNRKKYLAVGLVLLLVTLGSLCISTGYDWRVYSPLEVLQAWIAWPQVQVHNLLAGTDFDDAYMTTLLQAQPNYYDITATGADVVKYLICGVFLALAGSLYQNAFRNPIAAPSMLGVSNGVNIAVLLLVLVFGSAATAMEGYYYLFSFIGGALVLLLVMAGGKWISGKNSFNTVNMLLMGTVISQLLGVIVSYVQTNIFTEDQWYAYYQLTSVVEIDSVYTYISLVLCAIVAIVPVILFRMRLNMVSFTDEEARLIGVDPQKLRFLALGCGSLLILCAQINAGQVAMVSLVVPFVARAFFGAEFRKQLWGNVLLGALLMVICFDIASFVEFGNFALPVGTVVSIVVLPVFVWMVALRQRSWE